MCEFIVKKEKLKALIQEMKSKIKPENSVVFMRVGSDKYVADSLGPIVAEILKKRYMISTYVYGGLDYNINATNLTECYKYIKTIHPYSQIVLIDATLGDNIGEIFLTEGAYAGMGKVLPLQKFGDWSILGVVGKKGRDFRLNTVKLQKIIEMAELISQAVFMAL